MGTGFDQILKAAASRQQASSGGTSFAPGVRQLTLAAGQSARVRFLEEGTEVNYAWMCKRPSMRRKFGEWEPSLDQGNGDPCPMREAGLPASLRVIISLIWRDCPTYQRDADGKILKDANNKWIPDGGTEECLAQWNVGIRIIEMLAQKDRVYKGLKSRDFVITRHGANKDNTVYTVEPFDPDGGPQPMSESDLQLETEKPDVGPLVTPKSYSEVKALLGNVQTQLQQYDTSTIPPEGQNMFLFGRGGS
jgi:hypothetical protein